MKTLETDRLILRKWKPQDRYDLFEYAKNPLVGPNAGWPPHKTIEMSDQIINIFIDSGEVYAVVLKSENKVIGSIGLHDRKPDDKIQIEGQREIGYVLNPDYWGKGYMPEAVLRVLDFGFKEMRQQIIWCLHFEGNDKSRRVIEKCGFKFRFKKKKTLPLLEDREVNDWIYNIRRSDFLK